MSYKDITFCPFYKECEEGENCFRALTPEILGAAKEYLICQFLDKPECFKEKEDDK